MTRNPTSGGSPSWRTSAPSVKSRDDPEAQHDRRTESCSATLSEARDIAGRRGPGAAAQRAERHVCKGGPRPHAVIMP